MKSLTVYNYPGQVVSPQIYIAGLSHSLVISQSHHKLPRAYVYGKTCFYSAHAAKLVNNVVIAYFFGELVDCEGAGFLFGKAGPRAPRVRRAGAEVRGRRRAAEY